MVQWVLPDFDEIVKEYQNLSSAAAASSPPPFLKRLRRFISGEYNLSEAFGPQTSDARAYCAFMRRYPSLSTYRRLLVAHTAADLCSKIEKLEKGLTVSPQNLGFQNALALGQTCYEEMRNRYIGL